MTSRHVGSVSVLKSNDPLHGVTLERMLTELVAHFGWQEMGDRIAIRCFRFDPSIKSSLAFLRKTPWARKKVEALYADWKVHTSRVAAPPINPKSDDLPNERHS
jgi:uncharacterized protein (DUF2132 family)